VYLKRVTISSAFSSTTYPTSTSSSSSSSCSPSLSFRPPLGPLSRSLRAACFAPNFLDDVIPCNGAAADGGRRRRPRPTKGFGSRQRRRRRPRTGEEVRVCTRTRDNTGRTETFESKSGSRGMPIASEARRRSVGGERQRLEHRAQNEIGRYTEHNLRAAMAQRRFPRTVLRRALKAHQPSKRIAAKADVAVRTGTMQPVLTRCPC